MINKVTHVSFGTSIHGLKYLAQEENEKNRLTDEHLRTLNSIKYNCIYNELVLNDNKSVIMLKDMTLYQAKEECGKSNIKYKKYKKYNDALDYLKKAIYGDTAKPAPEDKLTGHGLPVKEFADTFKAWNTLPKAIYDKCNKIKEAFEQYKSVKEEIDKKDDFDKKLKELFSN